MNLTKQNFPQILKYSLPKRFQDISPTDFEDLIAQLFKDMNYIVEQTSYSGDFGADIIVKKDNIKTVVQIKRYAKSNKVSVGDINQVLGAKNYYDSDKCMIITTSDYTKPAYKLMAKTNVVSWNWDKLQSTLSEVYLDGKDVYKYFPEIKIVDTSISLKVKKIDYEVNMKRIGNCTHLTASLVNNGKNCNISLELPIIITKKNKQIESVYWFEGYFNTGTVYSGAEVDVSFMFLSEQLPTVGVGDRLIFNYFINEEYKTLESEITSDSHSGCYIATLCFGVESNEYDYLTFFRDNYLLPKKYGRKIVGFYYKYSGLFIRVFQNSKLTISFSKIILKSMIFSLSFFYRKS
jgi:hypothetical protein|tara:strand:+ start:83 stop:1129 length:1047 start_codon:yes stop_codon:yes gene_type:complete